MSYRDFEEYSIKNQHCTAEEIDERQALELGIILEKWEAGTMPVEAVLVETANIVCGYLCDRNGTPRLCRGGIGYVQPERVKANATFHTIGF